MKNTRIIMAVILFMAALGARAQYVAIPDTNFGTWLNTHGYAGCLTGNNTTGWHLDTTCPAVTASQGVDCSNANIHDLTGVQYFKNLRGLYCDSNHLTFLPRLTDSLSTLQCRYNQIGSLPALPHFLQNLNCEYNSLTTLPTLPIGLYSLVCTHNLLTTLPSLPDSLFDLYCTFNNLTSLPSLPVLMTQISCGNNHLTSLPVLNDSLTHLSCNYNNLTSLPVLPAGLGFLECSNNSITSLPAILSSVVLLSCTHNSLTSLPSSLNNVGFLSCSYNSLTSLPALPNSLYTLYCDHNNLSSLSVLPDSLYQFKCNKNSNINCLPYIHRSHLNVFDIDSTNIQCLPNHFTATYYDLRPDSLPICGVGNVNGCQTYYGVLIPDTNFGTWLYTNGYSTCLTGSNATGWYMDTTCTAVLRDTTIVCSQSNIHDLTGIQYFKSLNWLDCDSNSLSSLPLLPVSVTYLDISNNHFITAPSLPANLQYLFCAGNQINLSTLPNSLIFLHCPGNNMTSLPALPGSLLYLSCYKNQITNLPSLPVGLKQLVCSYNPLTTLPALPDSLSELYCSFCHLTSLPYLPKPVTKLLCDHNPNLSCLPEILQNNLTSFWIDSTNIQCMPNYFTATNYDRRPDSLPICGVGNINGCAVNNHSVLIPDTNFGTWLYANGYAACLSGNNTTGWYLDTLCSASQPDTIVHCTSSNIYDLTGIYYLKNVHLIHCGLNNLTTIPRLPDNVTYLECIGNQITSIPSLPGALVWLDCRQNQLTTLPVIPAHVKGISCGYNQITTLPAMPGSLQYLQCDSNHLTSLPTLAHTSLITLDCKLNNITTIPALPATISSLGCMDNPSISCLPYVPVANLISLSIAGTNIQCMPNHFTATNYDIRPDTLPICGIGNVYGCQTYYGVLIPDTNFAKYLDTAGYASCLTGNSTTGWWLDTLCSAALSGTFFHGGAFANMNCSGLNIHDLTGVQYFKSITGLYCNNNPLVRLPVLPDSLTYLYCAHDSLTSLPVLPNSIITLYCYGNPLTTLPTLPTSLMELYCNNCQLTSLPPLPNSLYYLNCWYNNLTSLPTLPDSLGLLLCHHNQLTILPLLPANIIGISCGYNQLTSIPNFPDSLGKINLEHNPNLSCLPLIQDPHLAWLYIDSTNIQCLPNRVAVDTSDVNLSSMPICAPGNANGCSVHQYAGPDQTICQNATATMSAVGTGRWSVSQTNPTFTSIFPPSSPTVVIHGFSQSGVYSFIWTTTGGSDTVNVTVSPAPAAPILSASGTCLGSDTLSLGASGINQINWFRNNAAIDSTSPMVSTVAGGNGVGTAADQLNTTVVGICLDGSSNLYVADLINDRVLRFPPGSTSASDGVTVAANQLRYPSAVFVDRNGDIYVSSLSEGVLKYPVGSDSTTPPIVVAGGNGIGNGANQFNSPGGLYVDINGNIYVSDANNSRIQKFPAGSTSATNGVTVAGSSSGTGGSAANQLSNPLGIFVDNAGNLYVADQGNSRVQKFPAGSTSATNGVTVAGGNGQGSAPNQLGIPTDVYVDGNGNVYVCDGLNNNVKKFPSGSTSSTIGVIVAGGNGQGGALNQLSDPLGITLDSSGNIYISDSWNHRIQKWSQVRVDTSYIPSIAGSYSVSYISSVGCSSAQSNAIVVTSCALDSVWPGDADNNHIADNNDLLPIGLAYDSIGPVRAVQGIVWQADAATDWTDTLPGYSPVINYKHADCDGNGIIDAHDTTAIMQNFGLIHAKTDGYNSPWRSGIPSLTVKLFKDTAYAGDTLTAILYLGDSLMPVPSIYGLAFTFHYNTLVTDSNTTDFHFSPSWLGTGANSINISKTFHSLGQVKAAITGINHIPRTGYGQIAKFRCIITTDNINGKDFQYYSNQAYISDIKAIDERGNILQMNAGIDSNQVGYTPTGIREATPASNISVYPNPAADRVRITSETAISSISLIDAIGKEVYVQHTNHKQSDTINVSDLAPGVYIIHVSTAGGTGTAKLVISR